MVILQLWTAACVCHVVVLLHPFVLLLYDNVMLPSLVNLPLEAQVFPSSYWLYLHSGRRVWLASIN